jgi:hypothetical protein
VELGVGLGSPGEKLRDDPSYTNAETAPASLAAPRLVSKASRIASRVLGSNLRAVAGQLRADGAC